MGEGTQGLDIKWILMNQFQIRFSDFILTLYPTNRNECILSNICLQSKQLFEIVYATLQSLQLFMYVYVPLLECGEGRFNLFTLLFEF